MDVITGLQENQFSLTQALQKGLQVTSEYKSLFLTKKWPEFIPTIRLWRLVLNAFYLPQISKRIQTSPLFFDLISGSRKGWYPWIWMGWRSWNKGVGDKWRVKFAPTSSMQISSIKGKTGYMQPQYIYTTELRWI